MSFGVGDPAGIRTAAEMVDVQARRLEVSAHQIVDGLADVEYIGKRSEELRSAATGMAGLLAADAEELRAQAKLLRALADRVEQQKAILRQRELDEERKQREQKQKEQRH